MRKIILSVFLLSVAVNLGWADDVSFHRIEIPDAKGHHTKAVLTFSDSHKAVQVQPVKGNAISIPFSDIDKFTYEYTQKHRVNEGTIATAPIGVGAVMMMTKSKSHWLQIDYHDGDQPHVLVLRMDKRDYLRILDAVKAHTGMDVEVLGNAKKR